MAHWKDLPDDIREKIRSEQSVSDQINFSRIDRTNAELARIKKEEIFNAIRDFETYVEEWPCLDDEICESVRADLIDYDISFNDLEFILSNRFSYRNLQSFLFYLCLDLGIYRAAISSFNEYFSIEDRCFKFLNESQKDQIIRGKYQIYNPQVFNDRIFKRQILLHGLISNLFAFENNPDKYRIRDFIRKNQYPLVINHDNIMSTDYILRILIGLSNKKIFTDDRYLNV